VEAVCDWRPSTTRSEIHHALVFLLIAVVIVGIIIFMSVMGILGALFGQADDIGRVRRRVAARLPEHFGVRAASVPSRELCPLLRVDT
jgi:hypothetical protein